MGEIPITSPVDLISGPRTASTPRPSLRRNLFQGRTASLTEKPFATPSPLAGRSDSARSSAIVEPTAILAAAFANATPVALLTKGTVLEARGFASSTYKTFSAIAN